MQVGYLLTLGSPVLWLTEIIIQIVEPQHKSCKHLSHCGNRTLTFCVLAGHSPVALLSLNYSSTVRKIIFPRRNSIAKFIPIYRHRTYPYSITRLLRDDDSRRVLLRCFKRLKAILRATFCLLLMPQKGDYCMWIEIYIFVYRQQHFLKSSHFSTYKRAIMTLILLCQSRKNGDALTSISMLMTCKQTSLQNYLNDTRPNNITTLFLIPTD